MRARSASDWSPFYNISGFSLCVRLNWQLGCQFSSANCVTAVRAAFYFLAAVLSLYIKLWLLASLHTAWQHPRLRYSSQLIKVVWLSPNCRLYIPQTEPELHNLVADLGGVYMLN